VGDIDKGEAMHVWGYGKYLYLPFNFAVNLKLFQKTKSFTFFFKIYLFEEGRGRRRGRESALNTDPEIMT